MGRSQKGFVSMSGSTSTALPALAAGSTDRILQDQDGRLSPARSADHAAVYHLLTRVFQGPSRSEFRAGLEDPAYHPRHRLLMHHGGQLVGHVQMSARTVLCGGLPAPAAMLDWLGVLPAFRGQDYGRRLLAAAERQMAAEGALIGLLRTRIPHFFRSAGWARCGHPHGLRAGTRDVLATLALRGLHPRAGRRLSIRPVRISSGTQLIALLLAIS